MKTQNKWFMFIILLISSITVGLSQLKIAAVLGSVAESLGVSVSQAALLMSLFTVAGIVLAVPGAAIMAKTGSKNLLLALMASLVLGNVMGVLANSFNVMMISRVIEGISYAMIIMVGIDMISVWFADGGAGTATGIFNTFAAAANFIAMNASIPIMHAMGLKALWWTIAAVAAVCFILVLLFIRIPERVSAIANESVPLDSGASIGEALKNGPVLVMCLLQLCLAFVLFGFITCYPQLFTGYYGLPETQANFYSSLNGLFGIPVCIICGIVVEKTGKPFTVAMIGAIGCIVLCLTIPYLTASTYIAHVIVSAICPGGLVMTSVFIIVPQLTERPALIGYSMSFINLMYYIGVFASTPVILGAANGAGGWKSASLLMTAASVLVFIFAIAASAMSKKNKVSNKAAAQG
mgnify:CR=1 FL=1